MLLDSRMGFKALKVGSIDMDEIDEDWERYILLIGSAEEICESATNREYGDLCVVGNLNTNKIMFEWYEEDGSWNNNKH